MKSDFVINFWQSTFKKKNLKKAKTTECKNSINFGRNIKRRK